MKSCYQCFFWERLGDVATTDTRRCMNEFVAAARTRGTFGARCPCFKDRADVIARHQASLRRERKHYV